MSAEAPAPAPGRGAPFRYGTSSTFPFVFRPSM